MLEHHKFKKEIPGFKGSKTANEPISASFVNEWRTGLTPPQIAYIEQFAFDADLVQHYCPLKSPVCGMSRLGTLAGLRLSDWMLTAFESAVEHLRGKPFVWSRLGNMLRTAVFGAPQ